MNYVTTNPDTGRRFKFASHEAYERALDWYNATSKAEIIEYVRDNDLAGACNIHADADTVVEDWADAAMELWSAVTENN